MKFKIIADSSCDLTNDYIKDENIGFSVVPLTINIGQDSFVDDENINTEDLLNAMYAYPGKSTTACPSPGLFMEEFDECEYNFCITISSKLSGTYNSAILAKNQVANKVHVIDSKATSGSMIVLIDKLVEFINAGHDYAKICQLIDEHIEKTNLLFVLSSFDNLVKNGRMSKLTSIFATALRIKPLCQAEDGEIKIVEKPRTIKVALKRMVEFIGEKMANTSIGQCIISHCYAEEEASMLEELINEKYEFKQVRVIKTRGLCSFYALNHGCLVAFG